MNNSSYYFSKAVDKAWQYQFLTYPNPAVGAVVVKDNKIISCEAHHQAGQPHAEVLACKEAYLKYHPNSPLNNLSNSFEIHQYLYDNHNGFFHDCQIYVTLEPCNHTGKTPPCAKLLEKLQFSKVFIGSNDPNMNATGGYQRLLDSNVNTSIHNHKELCDNLLLPFTLWQKNNFVFFKLAARVDGSIDGGYITSQDSLNLVHEIRTNLDLLVIGGNTVRTDRPTLDSRFSKSKKAPHVLIYSKTKDFDQNINLFQISNRQVTISDSLEQIHNHKFVMIEGGYNMLNSVKEICHMIMLFVSHKEKHSQKKQLEFENFTKIHSFMINEFDEVIFFKHN
jgi:diaminohydroxyphosphoribosylaminopyrimidine deaminase/5-amino-6-(5-phosphoribosylamino)uracil reductase